MTSPAPELTLFISHSSRDVDLVRALITLIERSLKIPARQIRATSVSGYRLPVGADTDEQLRREIFVARSFVGVLTPSSVDSVYVMFELGARWGAKKHLAPVLAKGAAFLSGPLSSINTLRLSERGHVLQLLEDLAEYLEIRLEPQAAFQDAVDAVVTRASFVEASLEPTEDPTPKKELSSTVSDEELKVLDYLGKNQSRPVRDIASGIGISEEKAKYHLYALAERDMVSSAVSLNGPSRWYLKQNGRTVLVNSGLL